MAESAEGWLSRCIAGDDRDAPRKGGNIVPCTRALLLECSGAQSDSLSPLRRRDAEEDSQNSEGAEMAESAEDGYRAASREMIATRPEKREYCSLH